MATLDLPELISADAGLESKIFDLVKKYTDAHDDWHALKEFWKTADGAGMGGKAKKLLCIKIAAWILEYGSDISSGHWDPVLANHIPYSKEIHLGFEGHDPVQAKEFCKTLFDLVLNAFEKSAQNATGPIETSSDPSFSDLAIPDGFIANVQSKMLVKPVQTILRALHKIHSDSPDCIQPLLKEICLHRDQCIGIYEGFATEYAETRTVTLSLKKIFSWCNATCDAPDEVLDAEIVWPEESEGGTAAKFLEDQCAITNPDRLREMSKEGDATAQLLLEITEAAEENPGDLGAVCKKALEATTARLEDGTITVDEILGILSSKLNISVEDFPLPC